MVAGVASAQEAPSVGNTYVELGTTFENETTLAIGTGVGSGALAALGELSGSTDGNFQARVYTDSEFGKFVITPGLNYASFWRPKVRNSFSPLPRPLDPER